MTPWCFRAASNHIKSYQIISNLWIPLSWRNVFGSFSSTFQWLPLRNLTGSCARTFGGDEFVTKSLGVWLEAMTGWGSIIGLFWGGYLHIYIIYILYNIIYTYCTYVCMFIYIHVLVYIYICVIYKYPNCLLTQAWVRLITPRFNRGCYNNPQ